jgi:FimV-like protein
MQFFELYIKPYLFYLNTHPSLRYCLLGVILVTLAVLIRGINQKVEERQTTSRNFNAIAGDDVMATQLDLAKAYIEMGQKDLAITILKNVKRKGNDSQFAEAERLIKTL